MDVVHSGMASDRNSGGSHTSRTIQLADFMGLLAAVPAGAESAQYKDAVIEQNVLGKKTLNSRQRSYRYLRELYGLDPSILVFRALRDLWEADAQAQPLLAMLCSLARDPALRATAPAVLPLKSAHPDLELKRTWGGKNRLAVYCQIMDIHVPEKYGQNVAAKGIKAMREAIESYGSYSAITAEGRPAKDAWKAVLGHNRLDCRNAREVVTRAAEESAEI